MKLNKKRKICVITGTRAEYGLLKSVMAEIQKNKLLFLHVIATGMHLSSKFGYTVQEIKKDGFKISALVKSTPREDSLAAMAKSLGRGVSGISEALEKLSTDIVVVLGDRVEALAGALAAAYMNIPVAHIHGGDSAGAGLDEYARHAITKFSHIHFPATKKSAERIVKMGEDKWRVFTVGAPGLDTILKEKLLSKKEIEKKYKIDFLKPFLLLVQHPVTTESKNAAKQIKETLGAVRELGLRTIVVYPNADAGGKAIIDEIEKEGRLNSRLSVYKSLPHGDYLSLLANAGALVGNSSSGIIEAASFHKPVINIGSRQKGRERVGNVIDVIYKKNQISGAIKYALYDKKFNQMVKRCKNPYGDGNAGRRIVKILSRMPINQKLMQKKLTY